MRNSLPLVAVFAAMFAAPLTAEKLTIERIYASPSLTGEQPRSLKIAPDGSRVTFLRGKQQDQFKLDLWEYHVESGETRMLVDSTDVLPDEGELSAEEKARRERQRIAELSGIIDYDWTEDASAILFPLGGDIYLYSLDLGSSRRLTDSESFETDARLSPGGGYVSFNREQNLFAINLETGAELQLTSDGAGEISNGMAEFVAQEEMDRNTGYWWSPDDEYIAFLQVDNSQVQLVKRYEVYGNDIRVFEQRYPAAGTANANLKLGLVELASKEIHWLDTGSDQDIYIPRVDWMPDGDRLAIQIQSRNQERLELRAYEVSDGRSRQLLVEQEETWINLHDDLHFLSQSSGFLWSSERDGYRHLYLYHDDGERHVQLTSGDWEVTGLEGVDENAGWVYFSATKNGPEQRHLYRVSLQGGAPEQITSSQGTHGIVMPDSADVFIDSFSSDSQVGQVSLHRSNGERLAWLSENAIEENHPYAPFAAQHAPTVRGTIEAPDGQPLHWQMVRPLNFDPANRYPVIVHVYGGPTGQWVNNAWGSRTLIRQYWAQQGFVVFTLDNRGVNYYGKAFQAPAYRRLGRIEVEDQLVGVEWLKQQPWVDPEHIGVLGWSYGGYLSLMLLMQSPGTFAAGAAVAPVSDWSLYDTHYTERYMGTPQNDAEAYRLGNVLTYADQLQDPLLLIHGMADDNVLFTNSTVLMERLQQSAIPFDLMTYPGGKHSLVGENIRVHVYSMITDYFRRHLMKSEE